MNRWTEYLNLTANKFELKATRAGIIGHNSRTGENREDILGKFLDNHLPQRLIRFNGNIFDINDNISKEIDIIVCNDISLRFSKEMKMTINIESVASAITVKSTLTKDELFDCLSNLASIPQFSNDILSFRGLVSDPYNDFIEKHPNLFVFAYDGLSADTIYSHILEYYKNHSEIPFNRYPRAVIVNKKYMITFHRIQGVTSTGFHIEPNTFVKSILSDDLVGFPLARILNDITDYVDWLPYMRINTYKYFNKGYNI